MVHGYGQGASWLMCVWSFLLAQKPWCLRNGVKRTDLTVDADTDNNDNANTMPESDPYVTPAC